MALVVTVLFVGVCCLLGGAAELWCVGKMVERGNFWWFGAALGSVAGFGGVGAAAIIFYLEHTN